MEAKCTKSAPFSPLFRAFSPQSVSHDEPIGPEVRGRVDVRMLIWAVSSVLVPSFDDVERTTLVRATQLRLARLQGPVLATFQKRAAEWSGFGCGEMCWVEDAWEWIMVKCLGAEYRDFFLQGGLVINNSGTAYGIWSAQEAEVRTEQPSALPTGCLSSSSFLCIIR